MQNPEGITRTRRMKDGGREQIIAAARYLFARKGFHQTGMAELAERAAVSVGQLYRMFADKSDIIIAIIREDADRRLIEMQEINAAVESEELSVQAALEQIVLNALNAGGDPLRFEILAEAFRSEAAADVINKLTIRFRRMLRDLALQANPRLQGDDLVAAQEILLACLFGLGNKTPSQSPLSIGQTAKMTANFLYVALQQPMA